MSIITPGIVRASHTPVSDPASSEAATKSVMASPTAASPASPVAAALRAALFASALPGEADHIDAAATARILSFVEHIAAQRTPGTPAIAFDDAAASSGDGPASARRRLALVIVNDDMPFLVDSVSSAITAAGIAIERLLHPIVAVSRDSTGRLVDLVPLGHALAAGAVRESILYLELDRVGAKARVELLGGLQQVLADVRAAVSDWPAMLAMLHATTRSLGNNPPPIAPHASAEACAFLEWLAADNFTLLGARRYDVTGESGDTARATTALPGLGLLRALDYPLWGRSADATPAPVLRFMTSPEPLLVTKASATSTVHRRVNADLILVKNFDREGRAVAVTHFVGLFTSAALAISPRLVPLLRRKVGGVIDGLGFDSKGHTGKALVHVIESFPREELFEATSERLRTMALGLLSLLDRPRPKLFVRTDVLGRFVSVLVYVPRDAYTSGIRESVGNMLTEALGGQLTRYEVELRAEGLARVHYIIATTGSTPSHDVAAIDEAALNARLDLLVRGWDAALENALTEAVGPARAARLRLSHAKLFSASYRAQYSASEAAADIVHLSRLVDARARDVQLYRRAADSPHQLRLKIYRLEEIIPLSDAVPVLENFGLRVIEEFPFDLDGGRLGWIHDFLLEAPDASTSIDIEALRARLEPALRAVLLGTQENDGFNALVVASDLDAEAANWLRAYFRYLRQTGVTYGLMTVVDALRRYPALTAALVTLFRARFAPGSSDRDGIAALAEIEVGLSEVAAIDDDRIIRLYRAVIAATLRTNAFVLGGPVALAFKLDSHAVPNLPPPVPYREIWVFSRRLEGIHLRHGPIARGGLRWSDRRDDFRTEVLGLVKAQTVKNTVIVPTGAKGGFYPKELPSGVNRDAWVAEGTEAYKIFVRTLLSLTDNLAPDGSNISPPDVVCHDAPDPYLVVAADKGTATFSDTANAISLERGFWLGDAFASGGEHGYDHKAMAITAKGAWISVTRHFRELGIDVQTATVRVAGVGDMSGDVFGNGMLLSQSLKLVAAFDHRHIFLDPNPDPVASFSERQRLFALPRSSWDDYDKALISAGGGVFPRSQKAIPLSPEVRAALGIEATMLSPSELIIGVLKAKVDLLWFGGIGTYVKAASESSADVGDRANDAHRINGGAIGAMVVGEGANLGLTQAGRIEYAARGGRLNTDFIDNSAGVDCSDNEVNIKIALNPEVAAGHLDEAGRNALLTAMTEDVAALVLRDNHLQTQALSIAERGGVACLPVYIRLIQLLETSPAGLDRDVEGLATDDTLLQRARGGQGLERPELAVIMAYAKMAVYDALVGSAVCDDARLHPDLTAAFPPLMVARFPAAIEQHRLRRELIATKLANELINRGGLTLPFQLAEELGVSLDRVAAAFVAARELFDFRTLWSAIDTADVPGTVQLDLHLAAIGALRTQMSDLLRAGRDATPSQLVAKLQSGIDRLADGLDALLRPEPKAQLDALAKALADAGSPPAIAAQLVRITALDGAVGTGLLAADLNLDEPAVAAAYTDLGEALGLDWAKNAAAALAPADPWERLLQVGLIRDFEQLRLDLLARITPAGGDPRTAASAWQIAHADAARRLAALVNRARNGTAVTTAMLAHVASEARLVLG